MTNSFKEEARHFLLPLHFCTRPSKLFKFPEIVKPLPVFVFVLFIRKEKVRAKERK